MKRILSFLAVFCMCIGVADAAVRAANSNVRNTNVAITRTTKPRGDVATVSRGTTTRPATVAQREIVQRTATPRNAARTTTNRNTTTVSRAATTNARTGISRSATKATQSSRISRAAQLSDTFSVGYNACRDAYFTCMDQFCANANDTYRRCICSARLDEIKTKQRALANAADQIQDFKDLNIEAIPKTPAEVNAMLSASEGEYAASIAKDTSESAKKLAGISDVLTNTKSKSLSMAGTLDIAGDINAIWATTNLASGANIANLTGETLYNAVHSQCVDLVANHCESKSTLNMVVSAYGMYIENDCTILANALGKQKTTANMTIRETEREMNQARLENYNAHNSTSINDCVAKVRVDITADTACGKDYIHCLDTSGLYLNKSTGEPIYSPDFYQLETMASLTGDILKNQTNRLLVAELNRKRVFAEKSLSTCTDLADEVWDEFMRQAITEIYQGQQSRIRQVKEECLDVVNKCYDEKTASLRDFTNTDEQLLLGSRLELSEQLCREKLTACSNLYGGGSTGLQELIDTMYNITSQKIAQNCASTLQEYAMRICAVQSSDSLHSYPYSCRVYSPGEQKYAKLWACQNQLQNKTKSNSSYDDGGNNGGGSGSDVPVDFNPNTSQDYMCHAPTLVYQFTSCKPNYYLSDTGTYNRCLECPTGATCAGGTARPVFPQPSGEDVDDPCSDYVGSLYQKLVRYALEACERPSKLENIPDSTIYTPISSSVLQDVNATMDSIRVAMSKSLQAECERLDGYWVATQHIDKKTASDPDTASNLKLHNRFYNETGANKKWGYCADKTSAESYFDIQSNNSNTQSDDNSADDGN